MPPPYTSFVLGDPSQQQPVVTGWISFLGFGGFLNTDAPLSPIWASFTFANGVSGQEYSEDFDLAPSSAPTTYSVVDGALPDGLSLSNVSACVGRLSGTPTVAGTFTFTLRATNAYGTADKAFSITINAAAPTGGAYVWIN